MRGTIRKRPRRDGTLGWQWQLTVRDGGQRRHLVGTENTRRDAERAVRAAVAEWEEARLSVDRRGLTFAEFSNELLDGLEHRGELRPSTLASYRSNLELHVFPTLGHLKLRDLDARIISRLYARLYSHGRRDGRGGLSATSVNYVHRIVHRVLAEAVRERVLTTNPSDLAKKPKSTKAEMKYWTPRQVSHFLRAVSDDRHGTLYRLALTSGLRRGEVLGLRWPDLDLEAARVTVRRALVDVQHTVVECPPKTISGERTIAIDAETVQSLKAHRRRQIKERMAAGPAWADEEFVFADELGRSIHPNRLAKAFSRTVKSLDVPKIPFHGLRHSHATAALAAGVPARVVQERLGHSSITVTLDRYAHVLPQQDADAATRTAAMFEH